KGSTCLPILVTWRQPSYPGSRQGWYLSGPGDVIVKMSKSLGNLVRVQALREQGVDPALIRLGLFAGHYRVDRSWSDELLERAHARYGLWCRAIARGVGADAAPAIAELRERLADDLDTPGALAVIDAWASATLDGDDSDPSAGAAIATALDALLGIPTISA
ncbi:MAG: hypothetical protein H5T80_05835, partial [Dietzia sp.]|nr:hypothetical protein [Dietzia sp.]